MSRTIDSLLEPLLAAAAADDNNAMMKGDCDVVEEKKEEKDNSCRNRVVTEDSVELGGIDEADVDVDEEPEDSPLIDYQNQDDDVDEQEQEESFPIFRKTLLPDKGIKIGYVTLVEGGFAVKLLKFTLVTFGGIGFMYHFVRLMNWEHRTSLQLAQVWRYEAFNIFTDIVMFFVVGRLFRQRGVDHLAWLGWCMAANLYCSYITDFKMFQHSFTIYEMHCRWPWQLWVFVGLAIPSVTTVGILHFVHSYRQGRLVPKFVEIFFCCAFLLAPAFTSSYMHLHHWFAGLILGMHFNIDVWWSRAAMAWCWGCYINGVAVYGRDPVLTCAYAYYMAATQNCPFISCFLEAAQQHGDDGVVMEPMKPPNWRNCSADAFHP